MSSDRDRRYLEHIRDSIELIERRTRNLQYEEFELDIDIQDAVLWRLETLAEATGRLSDNLKNRNPEIRWRAIYGFRNIVAHGYMELRLELVWEIIQLHLPELKTAVENELQRYEA